MLMVSTRSHSYLFGRRCENVKLRIRKELAQQLSFARSSSLFAVASSNFCILAYIRRIGERVKVEMPQSEHLRQPKCFGPLRSTFMRSRVDRKPLVSEDACNRSEEHHTDGAAICMQNVYLSRAFKNLIQLQHLLSIHAYVGQT